jgi:hypothetical protein
MQFRKGNREAILMLMDSGGLRGGGFCPGDCVCVSGMGFKRNVMTGDFL